MEVCTNRMDIESRSVTYSFFSTMFLEEITEDLLRRLEKNPPFTDGELGDFFASLPSADLAEVRTKCASEFASLLLNMSSDPVFPYESVYLSGEHLLMQRQRDEVLASYRAAGFNPTKAVKIPEDHVAIELEFMARLCERELEAFDANNTEELERTRSFQEFFLKDHLLKWVPQMCDDIATRAKSGLYKGLAEAMQQMLTFEAESFELR